MKSFARWLNWSVVMRICLQNCGAFTKHEINENLLLPEAPSSSLENTTHLLCHLLQQVGAKILVKETRMEWHDQFKVLHGTPNIYLLTQ